MGNGNDQTLLKGRNTDGQQTYGKFLMLPSHKENSNKNNIEVPLNSSKVGTQR